MVTVMEVLQFIVERGSLYSVDGSRVKWDFPETDAWEWAHPGDVFVPQNAWKQGAIAVGAMAIGPTLLGQTLFLDTFDANTSANWAVYEFSADTAEAFAGDYSADGIPAAPNSGGTTLGVKFVGSMVLPRPQQASTSFPSGTTSPAIIR